MKIADDPILFYEKIPKGLEENKEFRKKLHGIIAKDNGFKNVYLKMCQEYLPIAFSTLFYTLNPQKQAGERNVPFIPWDKQVKVICELDKAIKSQSYDFGIEKTRKQGATEIVTKVFAAHIMFYEYTNFIVGSRVKNLVDNSGDFYTIFAKIDHVFNNLPEWMGISGVNTSKLIERKDMSLKFKPTNATINGETTNESFKAGSRSTALFLDEFGRVDKKIAEGIEGSIHDVCNCIVYGSTHWLGPNHPFNICINKPTTHKETLYWWENKFPHQEVAGLYKVHDNGVIEILDEEFYKDNYPEIVRYAI